MKLLKLTLIFVVVLGAIAGGFFLMTKSESNPLPEIDTDMYESYRSRFAHEWEGKGDWDENLFQSQCALINQLSLDYNVTPLRDMVTLNALEIVYEKLFEQWGKVDCDKKTIDRYVKVLTDHIENENPNAKENPLSKEIKEVNKVYQDAWWMGTQKINLTPKFDMVNSSWTGSDSYKKEFASFSKYREKIEKSKKNIESKSIYKSKLSHIKAIKDGISGIPQKLNDAEKKFYESLATQIIDEYDDIPSDKRDSLQADTLRELRAAYKDAYGSVDKSLNEFVDNFRRDAINNARNTTEYEE